MASPGGIDPVTLAERLIAGERQAVAQGLNLIDDRRRTQRQLAGALLDALKARNAGTGSHLIGMTGPPGVGKSSLTAALIQAWRARGKRVGILAVDPSSPISGGALLGDRLRMKATSDDDAVFVRSLSSRGDFGGLSPEVWPMSLVMLSAFDIVLVETVGVGQREIDVAETCDTTCFVAQPGSGDSIQFLKAGILEIPHILVVNKQDMGEVAQRTLNELRTALGDRPHHGDAGVGWNVPVMATSATQGSGIAELVHALERHRQAIEPQIQARRDANQARWISKRIAHDFGQSGLERLGGAAALQDKLAGSDANPLTQYDSLASSLAGAQQQ